jgi:hypothetical protein
LVQASLLVCKGGSGLCRLVIETASSPFLFALRLRVSSSVEPYMFEPSIQWVNWFILMNIYSDGHHQQVNQSI